MQRYDPRGDSHSPLKPTEPGSFPPISLHDSLPKGLVARDARRMREQQKRGIAQTVEPPAVPHYAIVLRDAESIAARMSAAMRMSLGKAPHAKPPRVWYRLVSLGRSYVNHQSAEPFLQESVPNSMAICIRPPTSMVDTIQQILVVDKALRLVRDVATSSDDGRWILSLATKRYPRNSCMVVVTRAGESWYLPLACVSVVHGGKEKESGNRGLLQ